MLSALSELIEFLHRGNVALVDILNILFADKALKALECLVLARPEVETAAMDVAAFTLSNTSASLSSLHHRLDDIKRAWQGFILHQRLDCQLRDWLFALLRAIGSLSTRGPSAWARLSRH